MCACFACCLCHFPYLLFFVNITKTKTVNFNEWFESLGIIYKYYKYFSKSTNLNESVLINQCWPQDEWGRVFNFNAVDSLILKISQVLMSSYKAIHCWSLLPISYLNLIVTSFQTQRPCLQVIALWVGLRRGYGSHSMTFAVGADTLWKSRLLLLFGSLFPFSLTELSSIDI